MPANLENSAVATGPEKVSFHSNLKERQCQRMKSLSRVQILATPWTAAHQAPPSMGFPRPEYWSGVPLPSPLSQQYLPLTQQYNQHKVKINS